MELIFAAEAPEAIGPYSHAVRAGEVLYCSGQTPLDPASGGLIEGGIQEQTEQALANIERVLAEVGLSLKNVVKTTVFLKTMDDFQGMNAAYERRFGDHKPARTTVSVRANPLDALVEIECIAFFNPVMSS
jgi:2-iminobutanoate/2-iminopropanoate deaminase